MDVNMLPFLIEALITKNRIKTNIAELYEEHKIKAFNLAKKSELYNHIVFSDGSIQKEVQCKQLLGLLEVITDEEFSNLIYIAYPSLMQFLDTCKDKEIDIKEIGRRFCSKNKNNEEEVFGTVLIAIAFQETIGYKIIKNDFYNEIYGMITERGVHYTETIENFKRYRIENISELDRQKTKSLYDRLGIGKVSSSLEFTDFIHTTHAEQLKFISSFDLIFDTEDLLLSSISDFVKINKKDLEEILAIYWITNKNQNVNEAIRYLIPAIYIKFLCKSYRDVKKEYFKNNKDNVLADIANYQQEISVKDEIIKSAQSENNRLISEKNKIEAENNKIKNEYKKEIEKESQAYRTQIEKMQQEIEELKSEKKELHALRKFIFTLQQGAIEQQKDQEEFEDLKHMKFAVIGGHPRWTVKMKEYLMLSVFINTDNEGFDLQALTGVEAIIFNTKYINHGIYYKTMNYARTNDLDIIYINQNNENFGLAEIKKFFKK